MQFFRGGLGFQNFHQENQFLISIFVFLKYWCFLGQFLKVKESGKDYDYTFIQTFQEIVAAIEGGCNIIPVMESFQWPSPETLPEDMRAVCYFNGIRYGHRKQNGVGKFCICVQCAVWIICMTV